jgi:hypothetical protein
MNVKCKCQNCHGSLEFESAGVGQIVDCPHCGKKTQLYISPSSSSPRTGNQSANFITLFASKNLLVNLCSAFVGIILTILVLDLFGAIKPPSNWRPFEKTGSINAQSRNSTPIPVESDPSNMIFDAWAAPLNQLKAIEFSRLWADTEHYADEYFLFSGNVRISNDPYFFIYDNEKAAFNPESYSQLEIKSVVKGRDGTQDIIYGFIRKDLASKLLEVLASNEQTNYSGCFLLRVPNEFIENNRQKEADSSERLVRCEIFAYGPDELSVRLSAAVRRSREANPMSHE